MTNFIAQRARGWIVVLGLVLATSCGISLKPDECACNCACTNGGLFCDWNGTPPDGTPQCELDCRSGGTSRIICFDQGTTTVPPPATAPVCDPGDTYATYAFCEVCTGPIPFERQIDASGCTEADAEAAAEAFAKLDSIADDGDDCNAELCTGSN